MTSCPAVMSAMTSAAGIGKEPCWITTKAKGIRLRRKIEGRDAARFRAASDRPAAANGRWGTENVLRPAVASGPMAGSPLTATSGRSRHAVKVDGLEHGREGLVVADRAE